MNVNNRFLGEYALTGAFFWVTQFIVWAVIDLKNDKQYDTDERIVSQVIRLLEGSVSGLPSEIIASSLIIAFLALIVVFFTGLVLDLLKTAFRPLEMKKFMKHVHEANWLDNKVTNHCPFEHYYIDLRDNYTPRPWIMNLNPTLIPIGRIIPHRWWPEKWKTRERLTPYYVKLHAYFLSFVLVHSNESKLEPLTQGTRLWRSSREISVAVLILFLEVLFILVLLGLSRSIPLWKIPEVFPGLSPISIHVLPVVITLLGLAILLYVSMSILNSAFSRLCHTLFSLFYITAEKVEKDNSPQEIVLKGEG